MSNEKAIGWQDDAWPYRLIWLSPTFYLIGGGPAVFITLLLNFIANVSPIQLR